MNFELDIDCQTLIVKLENKKNIKHCYLRVLDRNTVHIKANIYFTKNDAKNLIYKKIDWIKEGLEKYKAKSLLNENEFLYMGEIKRIEDYNIKDIDKFYRIQSEKLIEPLVDEYSKVMNLHPTSIKYRKNKRTWGSCNYKNGLNFNILLMKFPIEVTQYVVIHELAHIKEKNHSRKFWDLVERYCPDYKQRESLLKSFL